MRRKKNKRKGIAATEAAICLPILVFIWIASLQLLQLLAFKQQAQLLASHAATRVVASTIPFDVIESEVTAMAETLEIRGVEASVSRVNPLMVRSVVTFNLKENAPIATALSVSPTIESTFFSYRTE